jgi:hypothetical protein
VALLLLLLLRVQRGGYGSRTSRSGRKEGDCDGSVSQAWCGVGRASRVGPVEDGVAGARWRSGGWGWIGVGIWAGRVPCGVGLEGGGSSCQVEVGADLRAGGGVEVGGDACGVDVG